MRPFPPSEGLQFFVGDSIAQICLDPYGLQFNFKSQRHLVAELGVEQVEPNGTVWLYDCKSSEGAPLILHRLLCRRITAVEREELRLTFQIEVGSALTILADIGPHESGHIDAPETGLIVF